MARDSGSAAATPTPPSRGSTTATRLERLCALLARLAPAGALRTTRASVTPGTETHDLDSLRVFDMIPARRAVARGQPQCPARSSSIDGSDFPPQCQYSLSRHDLRAGVHRYVGAVGHRRHCAIPDRNGPG